MALIEKRIAEKMLPNRFRQFVAELGNQIGVLKSVVYVSEAYTGDCEQPFLLANSSDFWQGIAVAIVHAARMGFVHGDIKPANMVYALNKDGKSFTCKLIDFDSGFVRLLNMATFDVIRLAPYAALLMIAAFMGCAQCTYLSSSKRQQIYRHQRFQACEMARNALRDALESEEWVDLTEPDKIDQLRVDIRKLYLKMTYEDAPEPESWQHSLLDLQASQQSILNLALFNLKHYVIKRGCSPGGEEETPTLKLLIEYGLGTNLKPNEDQGTSPDDDDDDDDDSYVSSSNSAYVQDEKRVKQE